MGWKPVRPQGELVRFEVGEPLVVEGYYRGYEVRTDTDEDGKERESRLHTLETAEGTLLSFFGSAMLDPALERVAEGDLVRVEFTGKRIRSKRNPKFSYKEFVVERWEPDESDSALQ